MTGQMSIFDWLPELGEAERYPDINDIPEEEAVRMVGEALGLTFRYNDIFRQWEAKIRKMRLCLDYAYYNIPGDSKHGKKFLGTMCDCGSWGGAAPCSGIKEAIEWFRGYMRKGYKSDDEEEE